MRRTYKSKKDTLGSLDPRDLMSGVDEKSSAFDAFYIQNIKQTKREMSAMGTSDQHGAVSNKVRKRKYVRRIVKLLEPSHQESASGSVFLTPDKSIRVNKAPDPFDQLLNSSPVTFESTSVKKVDLFDQLRVNKPVRNYIRKKNIHKINYSSDSMESDKENNSKENFDTQNATDIKAHQLIIEKDTKPSPKIDESICKIVKNLSLINNLHKQSINAIQKQKCSHRLTKNSFLSPFNSPLSSTPLIKKNRSKSIFKFSPIRMGNLDESPDNFVTITEEQNQSSQSPKDSNNPKDCYSQKSFEKNTTPVSHFQSDNIGLKSNTGSQDLFSSSEAVLPNICRSIEKKSEPEPLVDQIAPENILNNEDRDILPNIAKDEKIFNESQDIKDNTEMSNEKSSKETSSAEEIQIKSSVEMSSVETSEVEPFIGFSKSQRGDRETMFSEVKDSLINTKLEPFLGFSVNRADEMDRNESETDEKEISVVFTVKKSSTSRKDNFKNHTDSEDHIKIDQSDTETETFISNIGCTKPYQPFIGFEVEQKESNTIDIDNLSSNSSVTEEDNITIASQNSDRESLYDTCCNSDESSSRELKEPIVALEKMSDSVFQKYYEKMQSSVQETIDQNAEDNLENTMSNDEFEEDREINELTNYLDNSNEDKISLSDISSNYEEADDTYSCIENRTISFVTTRRKNNATNNATILVFDDTCPSPSSSDGDKTVLSNKLYRYSNSDDRKSFISNKESPRDSGNNIVLSSTILNISRKPVALSEETEKLWDVSNIESKTLVPDINIEENNLLDNDCAVKEVDKDNSLHEIDFEGRDNFEYDIDRERNINIKDPVHSRISNITTRKSTKLIRESIMNIDKTTVDPEKAIILQPGKKWERSLSIYKRMTMLADQFDRSILEEEDLQTKGRKYRQSVINTMEMQESLGLLNNETLGSRRSTLVCKPNRTTIRIVKESSNTRISLSSTSNFEDLQGFIEDCDDTVVELSKLSIAEANHEATLLEKFHEANRVSSARDYVLRRCNQTEPILFDECYPDTLLKNCRKIGEGVYGEVYLWRAPDGRARVMKIVPIAGTTVVNGEAQKDFHEIIAEIVIAMELSALRAPIVEIECHLDEGKDIDAIDLHSVENATDVFNEVLTVRCVYGTYPSRLLDLWELYDETRGSDNDTPAALPPDQQFIVLELANAGQDLESFQFNSADQAYALFLQVAFGLAVGEESCQFEHRDLHWGNVLIAPSDQKYATFVIRGRLHRVLRRGVAGTIIDYSLSRVSLRARPHTAALYNDLATDESLFTAVGDRQFEVYRLMREKLGNDWKNFEPYTNILWLHYIVDKMITAVRYKRTNTKIHKQYIAKLKALEERILSYGSASQFVLTDNEY